MKRLLLISSLLSIISCTQKIEFVVENSSDIDRVDEPVVLTREQIETKFGTVSDDLIPVIKTIRGEVIASQADDIDGDSKWDELAFVMDIRAGEKVTVGIGFEAEDLQLSYKKRTQVRLANMKEDGSFVEVREDTAPVGLEGFPTKYQSESVSWENDKFAFRVYFDCRNVKDLFGKLTDEMILEKAGTKEFGSYHILADWGMDVLKCGSSLGSGGIAILDNDSLYRLGSTDVYTYKEVVDGPVRSIFKLNYEGWDVDGKELKAEEMITIWAGKYWFQSDVTVDGFSGQKELVTGIVTLHLENEPADFSAHGYRGIATHDRQSENNDELGMGILVRENEATKVAMSTKVDYFKKGYRTVPEKSFSNVISDTYYIARKIEPGKPSRHHFFSVWGLEDDRWKEMEGFKEYMISEAYKFNNPIVINL